MLSLRFESGDHSTMISIHIGHNITPREVRSTPYTLVFVETFNKALKLLLALEKKGMQSLQRQPMEFFELPTEIQEKL